jgi:hypothetical protein
MVFGRRQAAKDFKKMSPAERVQWCETKLNRIYEIQSTMAQCPEHPEYDATMKNCANARYDITNVLNSLRGVPMPTEYLSLWGRLNRWVSEWAEADRAREEATRRRLRAGTCSSCAGFWQQQGIRRLLRQVLRL